MTQTSGSGSPREPSEKTEAASPKGKPTLKEKAARLVQAVWNTCRRHDDLTEPPYREDTEKMVVDAWDTYGQQGEFAVRDFRNGNAILGTYSYGQRRDRLQADLAILKAGKLVFDRPGEENMQELRRIWSDGQRRAREWYGEKATAGQAMPIAGREPGQEG